MHLLSVMSVCKNPWPLSLSISKRCPKVQVEEGGGSSSSINFQLQLKFKGEAVINSTSISTKRMMINSFNVISPWIASALVLLSPLCDPPVSFGQEINIQKGEALFGTACIGCHYAGGNIIQPGATLFLKDLQRNNITTEEDIYKITYYGNGRMPGFGEKCTPRGQCTFGARLADDDIKLLAEYVKTQADLGWANVEAKTNGD